MIRVSRPLASIAVSLALTSFAPLVHASPESDAKDLFARARDLRNANDCATAAPLFRKAWQIYPDGLGSLRNFAECEEQLGHFASSHRAWLDLRRAILAHPTDPKYTGWEKDAEVAAARLKPKVATFQVDVIIASHDGEARANESSGVQLTVNGEAIGAALVGTLLERDPGTYAIHASLAGAQPVDGSITVNAGTNPPLTLRLTRTTPARVATVTTETSTVGPPPPPGDEHAGRRKAGIVLAGVGGAALIGSLVTFIVKNKAKSDLDTACSSHVNCDSIAIKSTVDRGKTMTTLTDILFPVGLVATGAGAVLIITSRSTRKAATTGTEVRISPALGGVGVTGRF